MPGPNATEPAQPTPHMKVRGTNRRKKLAGLTARGAAILRRAEDPNKSRRAFTIKSSAGNKSPHAP